MSKNKDDTIPTNHQLAQRTQRIETQVKHVSETVDRIENNIEDNQEEIVEKVEANSEKVEEIWTVYRFSRWVVPIIAGSGGLYGFAQVVFF
jgi:t-SNARE complex subunit (syntaxin)